MSSEASLYNRLGAIGPPVSHPTTRLFRSAEQARDAMRSVDLMTVWTRGIKLVLSMLILTILTALAGGVMMTFIDISLLFRRPVEEALRQVLIDTLILLAVVEVFKTTLTYFSEGRVKVTFIVDTILVVMLTEVISEWFKGEGLVHMAALGAILLILGAMRIMAVRFSPAHGDHAYETF
jgi:uncharacterized membrane protein (DUF373 family)